jgi:hypothetical protein
LRAAVEGLENDSCEPVATLQDAARCVIGAVTMRPSSLRIAVLLGSTRDGPPRPANLSRRIGAFVSEILARRGHEVDIVDPVVEDLPLLVKPHAAVFPYARRE